MVSMDIFHADAFSAIQLTAAVEKIPYRPALLGSLGLFEPDRIRVEWAVIEKREGTLALIQTSERGAPLAEQAAIKRDIRSFRTVRLAKADTIRASELQNIRAFGSETDLQTVQQEVAARMARLRNDLELTLENHRLGAIQGIVLDADGTTPLIDWFTEWAITQAAEIDFALGTSGTDVRGKCGQVKRQMMVASKGAWLPGTQIYGFASDGFFDALVSHDNVKQTYLNWTAAADLRQPLAYETFQFGGITFVNYRGTDDGSTVAIAADKCKFFPVGANGVFRVAQSPAETFDFVNTPGLDVYAMTIPDRDRNASVRIELYSYPLFICTRPEMLQRGEAS